MKQERIKIAPLDEKTVFHRLVVLIAVPSSRRSIYPKEHNHACTYARSRNGTIPAALFLFLLSDASREWTALS